MLGRCLELAPTLPEAYSVQARLLKHAGDPQGAAVAAVRAQSLDLADRWAHSLRLIWHPFRIDSLSVVCKWPVFRRRAGTYADRWGLEFASMRACDFSAIAGRHRPCIACTSAVPCHSGASTAAWRRHGQCMHCSYVGKL